MTSLVPVGTCCLNHSKVCCQGSIPENISLSICSDWPFNARSSLRLMYQKQATVGLVSPLFLPQEIIDFWLIYQLLKICLFVFAFIVPKASQMSANFVFILFVFFWKCVFLQRFLKQSSALLSHVFLFWDTKFKQWPAYCQMQDITLYVTQGKNMPRTTDF